ncbi:hypothetical protein SISSUDRAFT_1061090 [Sistotremastrum suecicum HHB10207 ss-3]|uniref:DUF6535 domain-containing protein n=1 Tax=Sistotremastrum suecicum HHB10207 ss-3 TaxID=1314776 RepID=A0A166EE19_9AGAM|nr:hypothetical protein SISSUDRAFT_1061090 [Sistotremastrum suecicum HHB10207 ss-3]
MSDPITGEILANLKPADDTSNPAATMRNDYFGALLAAVEKLNATMEGVKSTLVDHGKKFDVLTKDALKDDQPYDEKELDDESTCTALYDIAMAKTKEKAEEWNGTIDVTLIFIALFSAVLTAFLVPATQALSPGSSNSSSPTSESAVLPPLPAQSSEVVCALYYLALMIAIIVAVLCVLGRQWVRKLTIRPDAKSWKDRTIWHVERMRRAEGWIKSLMETLYWSLLSSIGLFVAGLLYQLRILSTSFDGTAIILTTTWALGVVLAATILLTMIATTYHAVRYEGSVFDGLLSRLIISMAQRSSKNTLRKSENPPVITPSRTGGWTSLSVSSLRILRNSYRHIKTLSLKLRQSGVRLMMARTMVSTVSWRKTLQTWQTWVARLQVKVDCESMEALLNIYLELIAEASDPQLLERAAASFSFSKWMDYGDSISTDLLERARTRLSASDTSTRVRETVNAQVARAASLFREREKQIELNRQKKKKATLLLSLRLGKGPRTYETEKEEKFKRRSLDLTRFLLSHHNEHIYHLLSLSESLSAKRNADILDLLLPFDQCIAHCLCLYNQDRHLGYQDLVFQHAIQHCAELLLSGDDEDVSNILSHVDQFSVIKSIIMAPPGLFPFDTLVTFIVRNDVTLLPRFNKYLSEPHDWAQPSPDGASSVFVALARPTAQFHPSLDLSPTIAHLCQHPSAKYWPDVSNALISYLTHHHTSTWAHTYTNTCLELCAQAQARDRYGGRCVTSSEDQIRAINLLTRNRALREWFLQPQRPQSPQAPDQDAAVVHAGNDPDGGPSALRRLTPQALRNSELPDLSSDTPDLDIVPLPEPDGRNRRLPARFLSTVFPPVEQAEQ